MPGWPLRKNDAAGATLVFPIYDNDGDLVSGAADLDSERSIDQGTFTDVTAEASEIATSSGMYSLALSQAEINGDEIAVITKTSTANAKTAVNVVYTSTRNIDDLAFPTVSGRSTDTLATGEVGIDLDNVSGTLDAGDIGADAITAAKIADDAIAAEHLAAGAIVAATFAAGAINAAAIANAAIDAATFAAGAIDASAIAADAIGASEIAANAIGASELATDAVDEIVDGVWDEDATGHQTLGTFGQAIGDPVTDADTIFGMLTDIEDGTTVPDVNTKTITGDAITAAAIADGAIDAATFAAGAINAAAIANGAIDAATFAAGAIDATAIATGAIDADAIAADAITAAKIANAAIDAATFAAGALDDTAMAADAFDGMFIRATSAWEASAPVKSLGVAVMKAVHRIRDNAGTLETYRSNGTTLHASQTVTVDAALDPIDELTGAV